jgi:hypothetical protein
MKRRTALFLFVAIATAPASAEEAATPGRYALMPTEGGVLRLDTATGQVALCVVADSKARCVPASEAMPTAWDGPAALRNRLANIEERIEQVEAGSRADRIEDGEDAAVDRVASLAGRMMERLFAMVREMKHGADGN